MTPQELIDFHNRLLKCVWPDCDLTSAGNVIIAQIHGRTLAANLPSDVALLLYERITTLAAEIQTLAPREEIKLRIKAYDKAKMVEVEKTRQERFFGPGRLANWKQVLRMNPQWSKTEAELYVRLQKSHPELKESKLKELIIAMKGK